MSRGHDVQERPIPFYVRDWLGEINELLHNLIHSNESVSVSKILRISSIGSTP